MARFKPGESGNPRGREPGSKNKATALRESIAAHIPEILDALVEQARQGDTAAAKLLLDRALPALRPTDQPVTLPLAGADLASDGRAVVSAVGDGEVTPDQAKSLLSGLGALARVIETAELLERIERLEAKHAESD